MPAGTAPGASGGELRCAQTAAASKAASTKTVGLLDTGLLVRSDDFAAFAAPKFADQGDSALMRHRELLRDALT